MAFRSHRALLCLILLLACVAACSGPLSTKNSGSSLPGVAPTPAATPTHIDTCPRLSSNESGTICYTPHQLRLAYGIESLIERGYTGKGQSIIDIVSFGSPTLQRDLDAFNRQFALPPITVKVLSPLGTKPFDTHNSDMMGWAVETELDVQTIHAIAPDANIVVLTSPVSETEGTVGLPQFRQLEQYVLDHHLGNIVSQSWGASEVTLEDQTGRQELQKWDALLQKATTQLGMTYLSSSGDNGATDYADIQMQHLSSTPTTSFAADEPWVTGVGGVSLVYQNGQFNGRVWNSGSGASGGGFSRFYTTPDYQRSLPSSVQSELQNRRGVPDVAAAGDPGTELPIYFDGHWQLVGGTSASTPVWAGIVAIANQIAGHPLGFLNPALYKLAQSSTYTQDFHDITVGDNSNSSAGVKGYSAAPGWDAATGLGVPYGEKLIPDLIAAMR